MSDPGLPRRLIAVNDIVSDKPQVFTKTEDAFVKGIGEKIKSVKQAVV
jgi:putative methionine-R-sulfoxide reductase with GAF domain